MPARSKRFTPNTRNGRSPRCGPSPPGQSELLVLTASGTFLPEDADAVAVARGLGLDSVLVVPVRLRGLTVAVITCGIAPPRRGYRPSDGEAAEEVAGRVAAAVGRALLYREIQGQAGRASERAAQLRRLMEAALAAHARHTLDEVLAVVAEQARRVLGAEAGIASLPSERTGLYSISRGAEQGEGQEADAALLERVGAMARVPGGGGDLGHSHLLLRALGADEQARESVEAIRMAGERAANLSAQLLTSAAATRWSPS